MGAAQCIHWSKYIHAGGLHAGVNVKLNQTFVLHLAGLLFTPSMERNPSGVFRPAQKLSLNGPLVPMNVKTNVWSIVPLKEVYFIVTF